MTAFLPNIRAVILAAFPSETVALHFEPPSPAAVVTLYGPGGPSATPRFDGTMDDDRHVQVRVRDPSLSALQSRIEALYDYFRGIQRFSQYYMVVESVGGVLMTYPPQPSNQGSLYIASFNLMKLDG